ncbi:putative response regulator receiver RIM15p [Periconia macrospinosa]|uniref:non-specific serine/threonine protein kinase n=1 Tax=Periconia macrospinosa TaxID=97972 RepID=A0A2V1E0D1_9PLEO|nr:putative response regulator receiver RIM15p [Periconia macrospinosa]
MADDSKPATLAPPAVTALRQEAAANAMQRIQMERTVSQDMRDERDDLKEAAEHSLNVIMDLGMDGNIRYVSKSWKDVVGTDPEDVVGKPVADLLLGNPTQFAETVESIKKDDSRSHITRFSMRMGPQSVFRRKPSKRTESEEEQDQSQELPVEGEEEDQILNLEAQGIMVYDRTTGAESHTMWMIRPSVIREVTIDLPEVLVEALGVGAEMLANYLTELAEHAGSDPANRPPPPPNLLCRICERNITPWWFEKHTELCLQEHRAEMDVQMAQETLSEHRNAIVKVLDALEAQNRPTRATSADGVLQPPQLPEYKGAIIQPTSTPSSGTPSGRNSPASPPSQSRERSTGFGHHRARSFAVRRPLARIVELVLDLCDTALEVNTPAIKDNSRTQSIAEIRTQSPQSENRISQVLQWQSPAASSTDHCDGLKFLCDDTNKLARAKVDAVFRHRRILEYSERIRIEFDILVHECIDAAMEKAARIAAGEDSSSDDEQQECDRLEDQHPDANDIPTGEEGIFPGSFEGPSAMAQALRNASDPSLPARLSRRESSVAGSTRSNSPRGGCQTPRSHVGASAINIAPTQNKRHSMHFESDAGADSDSSMRSSSVMSGPRRADSPSSELGLSRVTTSRERKRKSLILPSVMTSRQHSPARSMVPPSSPLRTNKPRLPNSADALQSPITSPVLTTTEFSSPALVHVQHHRRQSSTAGSDGPKAVSPRLPPVTQPQPRALPPSIKDFEVIKPISKGAFGSVYLAKKKTTGEYYAIKVLRKADMVAKNQVTNVKAERAIMMWQGESDFVAKLYWTFSSKDYLYLVMEYLNGGDCASLIKVLGGLPEDWAKKYLAEVVLGVEHLHSRGIVHRDLKPDNLLIDQQGHLKLTDFGLSRMGLIGRQKRALKSNEPAPDLLKTGPFHRATSVGSSRSASFDLNPSPSQTPSMTPALAGDLGQPSYFSLSRESSTVRDPSRRISGNRSDSGDSEALQTMFRRFSIMDDQFNAPRSRSPIEEEAYSDEGSPDLFPLAPAMSQSSLAQSNTPPSSSAMPPPPMALFDPEDNNRRFVGTPDYLAPETIAGSGQDEVSDWWSLGCILFECLYGYPPFHADTPDEVFQNILARKIDWPENDEDYGVSDEAKDLMNKLMCSDPKERLGANMEDKFASGGEEIRSHIWFEDINWDTLREDEASFIPAPENPEDTEYFDTRGAAMANFAPEFEDQGTSSTGTPSADYPDRPHDALSRVRSQVSVTTMKRGLIPLHIPAHIREGRTRRLSEPMTTDSFGNFSYKNLPVLDKANKDIIQKMRAEGMHSSSKATSAVVSPSMTSPSPSLESSPHIAAPLLKRTLSTNKPGHRPSSPSISGPASSPSRGSQPSSPLLVQFSTGQHHERRKTSASNSSTLSHATSNPSSLQPGNFFEVPRSSGLRPSPEAVSPIKLAKTPTGNPGSNPDKGTGQRQSSLGQTSAPSPRSRSHTMGSQEEDVVRDLLPNHYKRRSQVLDVSPSSSDTEDSRQKALLRVQRRRQSSRRLSQISLADGPIFRPLDVLVCEDHPVSRLVMEKLLEKLRCRTLTVTNGSEAVRYAMGEVKFDLIMMEYKLPQVNGADVARMIRDTKNANSMTPIVAVTGYLKDLQAPHHFDALIEKPPTIAKLSDTLGKLCQWKPPPPNWTPSQSMYPSMMPSGLRQESTRQEDSPTSNSSGFPPVPSGSYRGSSREDSISSSFFGDNESRTGDDVPVIIARQNLDDWRERDIARAMGGLGISEDAGNADSKEAGEVLEKPPALATQESAPAILEDATLRRQRSAEMVDAKRRILETRKHESAESGDDEDDELGNTNVRTKSPKTRPRSSKLGIEMLRTNSRGSVISVEDIAAPESTLPSSPPPAITEDRNAEEREATAGMPPVSLTPPEIFPRKPGGEIQEVQVETPKASSRRSSEPDPDPTPRPNTSLGL